MDDRSRQLNYSAIQPEMHNEAGRRAKAAKMLAVLAHFRGTPDLCGALAVDLGCSTGFIADELRRTGATTVGVDIDVRGLTAADHRCQGGVRFLCADGEALPLASGTVDVVVFNHIYEHVVDPDAVVAEMARVLAPDGVVYLGLGNRWGIMEPHHRLPFLSWLPPRLSDRYVRVWGRADAYHERFRGRRGLRRMTAAFDVWDYTETVLADPAHFAAGDLVPRPVAAHTPTALWRLARPVIPTFIWVGTKNGRTPRGPRLRAAPRPVRAGRRSGAGERSGTAARQTRSP